MLGWTPQVGEMIEWDFAAISPGYGYSPRYWRGIKGPGPFRVAAVRELNNKPGLSIYVPGKSRPSRFFLWQFRPAASARTILKTRTVEI